MLTLVKLVRSTFTTAPGVEPEIKNPFPPYRTAPFRLASEPRVMAPTLVKEVKFRFSFSTAILEFVTDDFVFGLLWIWRFWILWNKYSNWVSHQMPSSSLVEIG